MDKVDFFAGGFSSGNVIAIQGVARQNNAFLTIATCLICFGFL